MVFGLPQTIQSLRSHGWSWSGAERTGAKVRQRTLLDLGPHIEVATHDWPVLHRRIKEILAGHPPLSADCPCLTLRLAPT